MTEELQNTSKSTPLLKASQVASRLSISRAKAYQLMQLGEIRSVQIGTSRRVRPQDLEAFILKNLTPGNSSK